MTKTIKKNTIFSWPARIYYEDTDAAGVVYYANYLKFMERARTEWLRAHGYELSDLEKDRDIVFIVRSVKLDYLKPARLNDFLHVTVEPIELGRSKIIFAQKVKRGEDVLVEGQIGIVCVSASAIRPMPLPDDLKENLELI